VTPKSRFHFHLDAEQREALRALKERDGIPEAEQIRRAIDAWLEQKGVSPKKPKPGVRRPSAFKPSPFRSQPLPAGQSGWFRPPNLSSDNAPPWNRLLFPSLSAAQRDERRRQAQAPDHESRRGRRLALQMTPSADLANRVRARAERLPALCSGSRRIR
jgi:hypothetical protein